MFMMLHKVDLWTKFSIVTMQMKFLQHNLHVEVLFLTGFFYSCERVNGVFNYVGRLLSSSG